MTRILITSALPYINGVKHLGNLVGSMLPADVYARYQRQRGAEVLYICATDEHGTPAELAAHAVGLPVDEFCAQQHEVQKDLGARFLLSWDFFGRSSSEQNKTLTQSFAKQLEANGLIDERIDQQIFSIDDNRFLPDRYIVGTCPKCGYENARGDQCENCTSLLDPTDLIEPRSAVSGSKNLEVRESKQLYLLQSKMEDRLRRWINSKSDWPKLVTSIALKWLDEGLQDRCITRDLSWGVPVERAGFEDKVFYVWFDAPIEYIAATKEWSDAGAQEGQNDRDWKRWWNGDASQDVRYVQFMAKDNIPFHTVGFPVTLFGSDESWKVVDYIKGFNWLTYYGGKFSTSQQRGVFMDAALDILPAEYWRYYLMANAPEGSDASFTWDHFVETVNKDLADVLGNFVNRILKFGRSRFDGKVPDGGSPGEAEAELCAELDRRIAEYAKQLDAMQFRKALTELRAIWAAGNEYLTKAAPWAVFKEDKDRAAVGVRTGVNLIRLFAILSASILPESAPKLLAALGRAGDEANWPTGGAAEILTAIPAGAPFDVPDVLFQKIDEEQAAAWTAQFGGSD
jgi:methionyl-tRNA synthetase